MTAGIEVERALLGLVTSVHVACGGHAGDDDSMTDTVAAALGHGVRVGAHPSYPDRAGFGRTPMEIDRGELGAALTEQLRALDRIARKAGTSVASVKAHGALYEEVGKGGAIYETLPRRRAGQRRRGSGVWCCRRAVGPWRWRCGTACPPPRRASATAPIGAMAVWSIEGRPVPC